MTFAQIEWHLAVVAGVGFASLQAIVAAWAARSRIHWFWRALILLGAILLALPIRAYRPSLFFLIASPLAVLLVTLYRRFFNSRDTEGGRRTGTLQFGLRDLLSALFVSNLWLAALIFAYRNSGSIAPITIVTLFPIVAVPVAILMALAHLAAVGPRRDIAAVLLIPAIVLSALAMTSIRDFDVGWTFTRVLYRSYGHVSMKAVCLALAECVVAVSGTTFLGTVACHAANPAVRRAARLASAVLVVLWTSSVVLLYWRMAVLTPFPPTLTDSPNHFHRIESIANRLASSPLPEEVTVLQDELLTLVDSPNHVPFDPKGDATSEYEALLYWSELSHSLQSESAVAAAEGDFDRAADLAAANVRVGTMLRRGGLRVSERMGMVIETRGYESLVTVRNDLTTSKLQTVIQVLRRSSSEREDIDRILVRDNAWSERAYGWERRLEHIVRIWSRKSEENSYREWRIQSQAYAILLETNLTIELFWREQGRLPTDLHELIPGYAPVSPRDVYTGRSLIYRVHGDSFVLYSCGYDRVDDGGRFGNAMQYHQVDGYDLDFETMSRP